MAKSWTALELMEMTRAFQRACVVAAAADLDVFTALGGRPASAATLADGINADLRGVTILLDALVALGLLDKPGSLARKVGGY